jgi:hypothetical protein
MASLIVDFEWPVAQSYAYEPPGPPGHTLAHGVARSRDGGTISVDRFGSLVAKGPTRSERPLDKGAALLKILLSQMPLRNIALMAAPTYGMLTSRSGNGQSEPLGLWKDLIDELNLMQKIQNSDVARNGLSLGARCEVLLLPASGRDGLRLAFRPVNLREAIKIFWATTIVSGGTLKPCKQCGEFFAAGGDGARRKDAEFCSRDCGNRFNNDLKRASTAR